MNLACSTVTQLWCRTFTLVASTGTPRRNCARNNECLQKFVPPDQKSGLLFIHLVRWSLFPLVNTYAGIPTGEPPYQSKTNGLAANAVHRTKEGTYFTSAFLIQPGSFRKLRGEAMECFLLFAKHTRRAGRQTVIV